MSIFSIFVMFLWHVVCDLKVICLVVYAEDGSSPIQHFSDGTGDVVQRKGYNNANDEDVREGPSEEASQS